MTKYKVTYSSLKDGHLKEEEVLADGFDLSHDRAVVFYTGGQRKSNRRTPIHAFMMTVKVVKQEG